MVQVLVGALAVLAVTTIVTESYIFTPVRDLAHRVNPHLGYLFGCFLCMSTWVGLGAGWLVDGPVDEWFVNGLAFTGLALVVHELVALAQDVRVRVQR